VKRPCSVDPMTLGWGPPPEFRMPWASPEPGSDRVEVPVPPCAPPARNQGARRYETEGAVTGPLSATGAPV